MDYIELERCLTKIDVLSRALDHSGALALCGVLMLDPLTRRAGLRARADVYAEMKERNLEVADREELVAIDDVEPGDRFDLGVSLWRQGRIEDAAQSFQRSVEIGGAEGFDYYANASRMHLAGVLLLLGRKDEALLISQSVPEGYSSYLPGGVRTREQLIEAARW